VRRAPRGRCREPDARRTMRGCGPTREGGHPRGASPSPEPRGCRAEQHAAERGQRRRRQGAPWARAQSRPSQRHTAARAGQLVQVRGIELTRMHAEAAAKPTATAASTQTSRAGPARKCAALGWRRTHAEVALKPTATAASTQTSQAGPACKRQGTEPTPAARRSRAEANGDGGEHADEQSGTSTRVAQHRADAGCTREEATWKPAATAASAQASEQDRRASSTQSRADASFTQRPSRSRRQRR